MTPESVAMLDLALRANRRWREAARGQVPIHALPPPVPPISQDRAATTEAILALDVLLREQRLRGERWRGAFAPPPPGAPELRAHRRRREGEARSCLTPAQAYGHPDFVTDVPVQGPTDEGMRAAACWWTRHVLPPHPPCVDCSGGPIPAWAQRSLCPQHSLCPGHRLVHSGLGGLGESISLGGRSTRGFALGDEPTAAQAAQTGQTTAAPLPASHAHVHAHGHTHAQSKGLSTGAAVGIGAAGASVIGLGIYAATRGGHRSKR
jgi:hypothetical protein